MIFITVFRTLFYQFFLIFIGLSIGFIVNAEWFGVKSLLINKSVQNIFFPLDYENDPHLQKFINGWGSYKIYMQLQCPPEFEIIDENVYYNEELYWCKYKYLDKDGLIKIDEATTRVRWKTWEYYYDYKVLDTPEKIKKQIEQDKKTIEQRRRQIEKALDKEKEILKNQNKPKDVT